jgi:hypothetical protein
METEVHRDRANSNGIARDAFPNRNRSSLLKFATLEKVAGRRIVMSIGELEMAA